eukprot:2912649-Alexandrium_andersonii.AAC.1
MGSQIRSTTHPHRCTPPNVETCPTTARPECGHGPRGPPRQRTRRTAHLQARRRSRPRNPPGGHSTRSRPYRCRSGTAGPGRT